MSIWQSGKGVFFFGITAICQFETPVQACQKSKFFIYVFLTTLALQKLSIGSKTQSMLKGFVWQ